MQDDDGFAWELLRDFLVFGGIGCIAFTGLAYLYIFFFSPLPYAGVNLQEGVVYVSARRFATHGLEVIERDGDAVSLAPWRELPGLQAAAEATVFVHGYNAQEHKVATYFADLVADLRARGYAGAAIIFDWPAVGVPLDELPTAERVQLDMMMMGKNKPTQANYELSMYALDQRQARGAGAESFLALLDKLKGAGVERLHIVGHSMGCYVLAVAMQQQPEAFARVTSMTWLAPDVDEAILGEAWFRGAVKHLQQGLTVLFSRHDTVLTRLSWLANGTSRLGATGDSQGLHPDGVLFQDVTDALGETNPHTSYLAGGNAGADAISQQILTAGR